jgi:hypothetical protein
VVSWRPSARLARLALTISALGLGSCGQETSSGWVRGSLTIPQCVDGTTKRYQCAESVPQIDCEAFDLRADFFALQVYPDHSAKLRMQWGGAELSTTDGLVLEIRDTRLMRGQLAEAVPVGLEENIRAGLGLFRSCPDSTQNFQLIGTIVFSRFGVNTGDRVAGVIDGLEVRDGRNGEPGVVLGYLHGNFDFEIQAGPPYQRFQQ